VADLPDAPDPAPPPGDEPFAVYLAKRLSGEKRFAPQVPAEAADLVAKADIVLSQASFSLTISFIVDRESDPTKTFAGSPEELIEAGRACLRYSGNINGVKMPVVMAIYEIGRGPPSDADRARLKALHRRGGWKKVAIVPYYLDVTSRTVWTPAPLQWLLGGRRWIDRVLREPRKADGDIFVPDPALKVRHRWPRATIGLLAFLAAVFAGEQLGNVGGHSGGVLGIDAPSLLAMGGMNGAAVLQKGEWYRLLSAALLHADLFHLVMNGIALALAGWMLEALLGPAWFLALFLLGALGGSLMGLLINPANLISVGASGAVMGLLAAALVATRRLPSGPAKVQTQLRLLQFLVPSLIPLVASSHGGRVDFAAHFGGAIAGALAGFVLLRIWPRTEPEPRHARLAVGLAVVAVLGLGGSLLDAKKHYPAYAADAAVFAGDPLVDDAQLPQDPVVAARDVELWGKDHPRDPRVHFFRALHAVDQGDARVAETELKAALAERAILDHAFPNKKLEIGIRSVLCELLQNQGRGDEAKAVAAPVCQADNGSPPGVMRELHLCD
jgi:rhomboid protease GluP